MRVVFLSFFPENHGGGEGAVTFGLAKAFSKKHQTAIIYPGDKRKRFKKGKLTHCTIPSTNSTIKNYKQPHFTLKNLNYIGNFLDDFNPDIIHSHNPANIGLVGQVWAIRNNIPFIFTTHVLPQEALSFGADESFNGLTYTFLQNITNSYYKTFIQNCTTLIALNKPAVKSLKSIYNHDNIEVVPNGRDLSMYTELKPADINSKVKNLTFIGFISERKNQKYLIKAFQHLPTNFRLILIGEGLTKEYFEDFKASTPESLKNRVEMTGQLHHIKVPRYLKKTHVFVSASKKEVQSLVIIEALASGTPVVGLSNETIDELVDKKVGKELNADASPKKFAAAIKEVTNLNQKKYNKLCRRARRRVSHLDWQNIVQKTEKVYKKAMKTHQDIDKDKANQLIENLLTSTPIINQFPITDRIKKSLKNINNSQNKNRRVPIKTIIQLILTVIISILLVFGFKFITDKSQRKKD
jgi:glycosyltransferase involved in cell wall biosynthesis